MMTDEKLSVFHSQFKRLAPETIKSLITDEHFTNVTLATRNGKQIRAHKVILGSSSSLFKKILINNPHPSQLIYLKDIKYALLKNILEFIYLGECKVDAKDFKELMAVGEDLEVEGLVNQVNSENGVGI